MIRSIETKTSPAAVTCVICQEEILFGKALCGETPTGEHVEVLICPRHVMPDWLRHTSPRLSLESARAVLHTIRWSIAERDGRKMPSDRRPATRTKIDPAPAGDRGLPGSGQVAPTTRWRQSLAGFCNRAINLLANLWSRIWTAGEGDRRPQRRGVSRTESGAIARTAGKGR
ncbi:MAG: hypothetical protein AB7I57_24355 [Pirellulales bacterium]